MQELLPALSGVNIDDMVATTESIIGPHIEIDAPIVTRGDGSIVICGVVRSIIAKEGTVVLMPGGRITESVEAKRFVLFGSIAPKGVERASVICELLVTADGSSLESCDVLYQSMIPHSRTLMKKVHVDVMGPLQ